jgi:hypothetical protein
LGEVERNSVTGALESTRTEASRNAVRAAILSLKAGARVFPNGKLEWPFAQAERCDEIAKSAAAAVE